MVSDVSNFEESAKKIEANNIASNKTGSLIKSPFFSETKLSLPIKKNIPRFCN